MVRKLHRALVALAALMFSGAGFAQSPEFHHLLGGRIGGVFFLNDDLHGWTAEDGARIRRSTDSGQTWLYGFTPDDFREELTDVYFIDDQEGWAVSAGGHVLKSDDGGVNWDVQNSSPLHDALSHEARLNTVFMFDGSDGWVGGDDGAVYVTSDGGVNWSAASNLPTDFGGADPEDVYKIRFFNANTGLMAADYAHIYRTTNGGGSWSQYDLDFSLTLCPSLPGSHPNLELWDFDFADSNNGWLVGGLGFQEGYVFQTSNGGAGWVQSRCFYAEPYDEDCTPTTMYAVTSLDWPLGVCGGYASTTHILESGTPGFDACGCVVNPTSGPCSGTGDFWHQKYSQSGFSPPLFAPARIDDDTACVTGAFGFIRIVEPGAMQELEEVANDNFERLEGGDFINDLDGCVVGQGNTIKPPMMAA